MNLFYPFGFLRKNKMNYKNEQSLLFSSFQQKTKHQSTKIKLSPLQIEEKNEEKYEEKQVKCCEFKNGNYTETRKKLEIYYTFLSQQTGKRCENPYNCSSLFQFFSHEGDFFSFLLCCSKLFFLLLFSSRIFNTILD